MGKIQKKSLMKLKISYEMRNVVEDAIVDIKEDIHRVNSFTYSFIEEEFINRERKEKMG